MLLIFSGIISMIFLVWLGFNIYAKVVTPASVFENPNDERIPYSQQKALYELIGSSDKKFFDLEGTHGTFDVLRVLGTN